MKLGPLVFSSRLVLLLAALVLVFVIASRLGRKHGVEVEKPLWIVLLAGLLAGRIPFVVSYREMYLGAPWSMLDIRDGGFNAATGIAGALIATFILSRYVRGLRKPLFVALLSGTLLWGAGNAVLLSSQPETRLPAIALSGLDGRPLRIDQLAGKPVVLNLWATWCPPCRREMPVLQQAQQANPDFLFVFANQGESAEAVRSYMAGEKLKLENVLLDPKGELARATGTVGMPTTLFFDRHGKLAATRVGEVSAATLTERMKGLRAED